MLTIQDFFSLFVDILLLVILYFLLQGDRAMQPREPVENYEEREQARRLEQLNRNGETRRRREENENHTVPPNKNRPTENDELQG